MYFFRSICSNGECLSEGPELIIIIIIIIVIIIITIMAMPLFGPLGKLQPLQVGLGGHYMSRRDAAQEEFGRNLLSEIEHSIHCLIS
jgi:hypothetical protein